MEMPSQIAERIVNGENTALVEKNRDFWVARITQSITVAIAAERERIAMYFESREYGADKFLFPDEIAAEIRSMEVY